jgi:phage shock protein C
MYCNYCGKSIQDDANVCAYCATRVSAVIARQRLVRPREGRKIAGVCLGIAEYFDLDPTLIRLIWLVLIFGAGTGLIAYIIGWIVMPEEPYLLPARAQVGQQQVTNP